MRGQPKRYTRTITGLELAQSTWPQASYLLVADSDLRTETGADEVLIREDFQQDAIVLTAVYDSRRWTG